MNRAPAPELVAALAGRKPAKALDLACGAGRHTVWLRERGWEVTAVDRSGEFPGTVQADLELGEFVIEPEAWDLIVCWLYWQPNLVPAIARGVRPGGVVAMAGKTSGRFAVGLHEMRAGFPGWRELASGENEVRCFLIVEKPVD
ncbi:MAG TPA: methyltransferase domain-containing protein [Bryobacteraceae bacterium]|nr:methyltransferase domain-containing protein [Bryobacteraceae bacterium]